MATLIVGDTHLGKDFDEKKFSYLAKLFTKFDQIILNGDFWDDSKCSFDEFVDSEWNKLFPVLKSKCIYIHGNHDMEHKSDERVNLFCKKTVENHEIVLPNKMKIVVVHGHEQSSISKLVYFFFKDHPRLLHYLFLPVDYLQRLQMELSKHNVAIHKIINYGYRRQQKIKNYILVTGHTHAPEESLNSKYINGGFVDHNFASYIVVDSNNLKLVKERY